MSYMLAKWLSFLGFQFFNRLPSCSVEGKQWRELYLLHLDANLQKLAFQKAQKQPSYNFLHQIWRILITWYAFFYKICLLAWDFGQSKTILSWKLIHVHYPEARWSILLSNLWSFAGFKPPIWDALLMYIHSVNCPYYSPLKISHLLDSQRREFGKFVYLKLRRFWRKMQKKQIFAYLTFWNCNQFWSHLVFRFLPNSTWFYAILSPKFWAKRFQT